ncbi:GNAT family N-acetyltransferase [Tsukamurella soli]|uniref:GNAT family N-acetyltransferase n=1 Tax=Tsukamurella soli TaxID=644556 RepID=UPI0031EC6E99
MTATAARLWPDGAIAIVDALTSQRALRQAAYDAALAWSRPAGSGGASAFPSPEIDGVPDRAYLYRAGDRVVGFLRAWPADFARPAVMADDPAGIRFTGETRAVSTCSIGPVWTHHAHRRQGVARALLAALLADPERIPGSISLYAPVSADGRAFVASVFGAEAEILVRW